MECNECLTYIICRNEIQNAMKKGMSNDMYNNIYISYITTIFTKCNLLFEDTKYLHNMAIDDADDYIKIIDKIIEAFELNKRYKINEPRIDFLNKIILNMKIFNTYITVYDFIKSSYIIQTIEKSTETFKSIIEN